MTDDEIQGGSILVRYSGLDADRHEIELGAFADSIKGLERTVSVAGNFAATEKFVKRKDAMQVKVLAAPPKAGSFTLSLILAYIDQSPLAVTVVGGLTVSVIGYIFSRLSKQKAEMKELRAALETAIKELGNKDEAVIDRLLDTVDKMAESLKPAVRQAISPIGRSVSEVTISSADRKVSPVNIGASEKEVLMADDTVEEIISAKSYRVKIYELNKDSSACRLSFEDDEEARVGGIILDPCFSLTPNAYLEAFASDSFITIKAKASIKNGDIEKLYISDASPEN